MSHVTSKERFFQKTDLLQDTTRLFLNTGFTCLIVLQRFCTANNWLKTSIVRSNPGARMHLDVHLETIRHLRYLYFCTSLSTARKITEMAPNICHTLAPSSQKTVQHNKMAPKDYISSMKTNYITIILKTNLINCKSETLTLLAS